MTKKTFNVFIILASGLFPLSDIFLDLLALELKLLS